MKAIVLRLPEDVVKAVDGVRYELRMDRTSWLRKAVRSQLEYAKRHELPLFQDAAIRRALQP
jgi:metal-responsive CopG/Arc/MetJ family transcriptional regulator